jgi:hypothetical protein
MGWDLAEWSERCASIPKITGSNPSGGSKLTFRSDLLLTASGGSTWALNEFACLSCYPGNTLCSQRLEPLEKPCRRYTNPTFFYYWMCKCSIVCVILYFAEICHTTIWALPYNNPIRYRGFTSWENCKSLLRWEKKIRRGWNVLWVAVDF